MKRGPQAEPEIPAWYLDSGLQWDERVGGFLQDGGAPPEVLALLGGAGEAFERVLRPFRPERPGDVDKLLQLMREMHQKDPAMARMLGIVAAAWLAGWGAGLDAGYHRAQGVEE